MLKYLLLQRHLKSHIYGVADQANTSDDLDDELVDGEQENGVYPSMLL